MKVEIVETGVRHFEVHLERLGIIGHIYDFRAGPFKFHYLGSNWMKMSHDEGAAVLAIAMPKVTLLNITKRLMK